jgi:TolB-like protein/DNA-binding winged helix-turn-helix (wHTH) protein/Flp pilus assembly protein TadD
MGNSPRRVKTGLFEIDLLAGQISRQGRPLPVQEQPFRVLAMLIDRPGELVSREEIQARLWPADTYVGFDEGLNTAVRKLRVVFQDSADNPRFIQTVPRKGYRFIAPVMEIAPEIEQPQNPGGLVAVELETREGPAGLPAPAELEVPARHAEPGSEKRAWKFRKWSAVLAIAAAVAGGTLYLVRFRSRPPSQDHARSMLVVLPFENLSGDPAQEYFSDGLTEETITDLGQLSPAHLGVIARTSSMAYKHTDKRIDQIGRELKADYILEGSVRHENGRLRISAQLIRVTDQTHLWAQSYDARNPGDLIDVQNAIGRAIAEQVQVQIVPQYQASSAQLHSQNPVAYDLYLQGRFYWNQRTPAAVRESIELFKQAISTDPKFAQGYAGLADAYNISTVIGPYSSREASPPAKAAATKALELDPSLAEAHAALGMEESHYEFDFQGAKAEFQRAIELNPNSAYSHLFYSSCFQMPMGLRAEAIAEMKKAVELDPLSLPINNFLAETYVLAGDYPAAYQQFHRTITLNPNFPLPHTYLASLLPLMGNFDEAIGERERGDLLSGLSEKQASERASLLRNAFKRSGADGFWKEVLAQDLRTIQGLSGGFDVIAEDYALEGDKDRAFEWLEKSFANREGQELTLLAVDPVWNNLHGDPRFLSLLHRIGLPELEATGH